MKESIREHAERLAAKAIPDPAWRSDTELASQRSWYVAGYLAAREEISNPDLVPALAMLLQDEFGSFLEHEPFNEELFWGGSSRRVQEWLSNVRG